MKVFENVLYQDDLMNVAELNLPWEKLKNSSVLVSGATGQFGSFFIDVMMKKNEKGLNCKVYALGRHEEKARQRFSYCISSDLFEFLPYDINKPFFVDHIGKIDYILHLASNTHPVQYSSDPIGTITTNIVGLKNMLDFGIEHQVTRFVFASSNEVYGENRGDVEKFDENYCGYIDCNTMRAGYPESKRCGEALCQAYIRQKGMDIVIPRFTRSFGPTLLNSDTKASSQFLHKAIAGEDIVLKSEGNQYYSYTYTADAVSGLFYILLKGKCGEAYNIAADSCDVTLKVLAQTIADICDRKVIFKLPDNMESSGYSKATKARLNGQKLEELGWKAKYTWYDSVKKTLDILRDIT